MDPRFTRTSAVADLHVPVRAGSDIAFLGGLINYVLAHDAYFHDYVVAYTNAPMIVSDDFRDTEDLAVPVLRVRRGGPAVRHQHWQYRDGGSQSPAAGARDAESGETEASGSGGALTGSADEVPQRDDSLRDPRCVFQVLKRHFERYTPEMVEQACGVPRESFLEVARALTEKLGPRPDVGVLLRGGLDPAHRRRAVHPHGIDPPTPARQHRPAGWRDHGAARAREHPGSTDIPTLYNLLPGYIRCRTRTSTSIWTPSSAKTPVRRASGATCARTR